MHLRLTAVALHSLISVMGLLVLYINVGIPSTHAT